MSGVWNRTGMLLLLFWTTPVWAAGIYSFTDERGVLHLTDRPSDARFRPVSLSSRASSTTLQTGTRKPALYWSYNPTAGGSRILVVRNAPAARSPSAGHPQPFDDMVLAAARSTGLDTALLRSIIRAESNFDPNATSAKGARGLMQLMPDTARQYGVTDITDPETNIHGGARFLADLLRQFNNDLELSLAAYNAGPTTVARFGHTIPPYPETRQYIGRVLRYYREYQQVM
ncbi:MAG: transglycosylase SLT domain-containing protein [Magnetococcus sp. MYC-9]